VVNLPAGGSKALTSSGASSSTDTVIGWARALSNIPVYGTVIYRASANGVPFWDVAAAGTGGGYSYSSQAVWTLGVALANPNGTDTIHLRVSNRDGNGTPGADLNLTLPPLGHTAFPLGASVSGMPRSFQGTISIISTDSPPSPFVAWTLYERDGLLSPLPEGAMRFPAPISRRPKDVLTLLQAGAATLVQAIGPDLFATSPEVVLGYVRQKGIVLEESATLKATYETSDDSVHVSRALVETMGASDAALAFVVGHMVARGVILRTGLNATGPYAGMSMQQASDMYSLASMVATGYDPGGMADFYSRLYTANAQGLTLDSALLSEFGPLSQITSRQTQTWTSVMQGCAMSQGLIQVCKREREYWHPSYPSNIP
jgi:hypothetical protein